MALKDFKRCNTSSSDEQVNSGNSNSDTVQTDLKGRLLSETVSGSYSQISLKEYEE